MAYSTKGNTLLPPDIWFGETPDWNFPPVQDSYPNRTIRIFARISDWLSEEREPARHRAQVQALWSALQSWNLDRPDCVKPIVEVDLPGVAPSTTIIFSNTSAGK